MSDPGLAERAGVLFQGDDTDVFDVVVSDGVFKVVFLN
jgi:hypothetical protein